MASSSGAKRKTDQENHVFQVRWETDYLFIDFKGKPMCLVCLGTLSKVKYAKYTAAARASALNASYTVALELAKAKKPLSDGEHIKRCAIEMAKAFGDDNLVKNFEVVSLSRHTVTCRVFDIHNHIEGKMKQVMHDCKYFSLALDESTDVMDVSQLLIFTRTTASSFEVHEKLLKLVSLHDTTRGTDILNAINNVANTPDLQGSFNRTEQTALYCTVSYTRLVGLILLFGMKDKHRLILKVKCNLHLSPQEALCARTLDFSHVMDLVTKITKLIRGGNRSFSHKRFIAFLDEVDAAYGDLQMHTDIQWMSRGKCLVAYCRKLKDTAFLCDMSLRTLPGHTELYAHMTAFQRKLELFKEGFSSRFLNLTHFPACEEMQKMSLSARNYFTNIRPTSRNSDAVSEQPSELQLELCDLQSDPFFQARRNEKGNSFWKLLPDMFGSTYICESSFLTMKHIKSKERNRLRDDTLFHLIRIGCTEFDIDIQSIVHQQAKPRFILETATRVSFYPLKDFALSMSKHLLCCEK
uniref:HAT C-terminal dimerisation domain-containing protein n=1 Tax=Monopterus albus TaxID=43700 RepID=A0A3Q3ISD0_MONAL